MHNARLIQKAMSDARTAPRTPPSSSDAAAPTPPPIPPQIPRASILRQLIQKHDRARGRDQ